VLDPSRNPKTPSAKVTNPHRSHAVQQGALEHAPQKLHNARVEDAYVSHGSRPPHRRVLRAEHAVRQDRSAERGVGGLAHGLPASVDGPLRDPDPRREARRRRGARHARPLHGAWAGSRSASLSGAPPWRTARSTATPAACSRPAWPTAGLPAAPVFKDVRTLTRDELVARAGRGTVDVITAGFPCQVRSEREACVERA